MKLYRYVNMDYGIGPKISLDSYLVIKETPCGYWIPKWSLISYIEGDPKRWVSKTSRKRFAYPTAEEAMINFKARKKRQILILTSQLESAKLALQNVEAGFFESDKSNALINGLSIFEAD